MADDNVVYLHSKLVFKKTTTVCEVAGQMLKDVVILGEAEDGTVKMMTTQPDPAELLFYLELPSSPSCQVVWMKMISDVQVQDETI